MCSLLLFLLSRDEKRQENSLKARLSSASRRLSLDEAETNTEENPTSVANEVTVSHLLKKELIIQLLYKWLRSKKITPLISSQHACLALHSTKHLCLRDVILLSLSHIYIQKFLIAIFSYFQGTVDVAATSQQQSQQSDAQSESVEEEPSRRRGGSRYV